MSDSSEGEDWLPVPKDENQVKRERKLARQKDRQEDSEDEGSGEEFSEVVKVFADDDDDKLTFQDLGLCDVLCSTVERLEWTAPTKIQRLSLPAAFKGRDIIGLAETGSGKTGAFALPMIQALLEQPQKLFGVILTPTRELAFQIGQQFEALGASIRLLVAIIVGGVDMTTQAIALAKRPHIIVATPGRLVDHLENTKGFHLRAIKYLVMDEADRILNMDFEEEVDKILKSVNRDRKTFLFSATMTKKVAKLERASLRNPVRIEVNSRYKTVDKLKQNYVFIPQKYKEAYLVYLLNEIAGQSTIIFTQTCNNAILIALMLRQLGFGAMALHGKMPQEKRMGALNSFKGKARNILVCTDVASRGLDIPHVDVVMNYDVPMAAKDYVHRVGRTARAGRSGMAITFVTQYDVEMYQKIEVHLGKKLTEYPCVESDVMLLVERATQAMGSAKVELREMDQKRRKRGIDSDDDEQYQPARYKKRIKTAKKLTVGDQKMNNKIGTKGLRRRGNNAYVYKV